MNLKKELNRLVKEVKERSKDAGIKLRNEDIASRLGYGRTYLSDLLGDASEKEVTEKHLLLFKEKFKDELSGVFKPSLPGDEMNRERAIIKVLFHEVAKLKAEKLGIPVESVLDDMEKDTMIAWRDLEGQSE